MKMCKEGREEGKKKGKKVTRNGFNRTQSREEGYRKKGKKQKGNERNKSGHRKGRRDIKEGARNVEGKLGHQERRKEGRMERILKLLDNKKLSIIWKTEYFSRLIFSFHSLPNLENIEIKFQ